MKGWRTLAYGILIAALSILSSDEMRQFIAEYLPEVGSGVATGIVILRALTNSPIFKRETN